MDVKFKFLVTGGCGFIGSNLVDLLVDRGHEVVVIDNLSSKGTPHFNRNATYHIEDLTDYDKVQHLFGGVDCVYHMASEVSIQYCVEYPNESMRNNILSTTNTLEASRAHGVKRVVFSSTSAVYGNSLFLPSIETNTTECFNTYSISKYTGEQLCKMYYDLYGMETISFRYFNVYGNRQPSQGQYAPVMGIFRKQKEEGNPLTIVGEGFQTRDFVNVNDVVEANYMAATVKLDTYGGVYNVGTGESIAIEHIARMISDYQIHLPPRKGEVLHSRACIDKIRTDFGWEPTVKLGDWLRENV
jgi:UDP-glucose 4-epimerase